VCPYCCEEHQLQNFLENNLERCIKSFRISYIFNPAVSLPLRFYPKETTMAMPKDLATKIFFTALVRIVMFSLIIGHRATKL